MKNPFRFAGAVGDPVFCNRVKEQRDLSRFVENSQNVLLYSHRRYGKTSLIFKVFENLKEVSPVYVDLYGTTTIDDFISEFLRGISALETRGRRLGRVVREIVTSIGFNITLDHATGLPTITPTVHSREKDRVLDEVITLAQRLSKNKKMAIALDEFQEIAGYGGDAFEKLLRKKIQHHRNISYIFSGSQTHLIMEMFKDSNRAFYKLAASYPLKTISFSDYIEWIEGLYRSADRTIEQKWIEQIVVRCEHHPAYIQQFFYYLWDEPDVSQEAVERTQHEIVEMRVAEFANEWDSLTVNQRRAVKLVAGTGGQNMFAAESLSRFGFRTASQLRAALQYLTKNGVLVKNEHYKIQDPMFRRWLQVG